MEQSYDITQGARRMAGVKPSMIRTIMNRAAELLHQGEMITVAEVAYQCGFSDPLYFSRCFKQYYGMSPSRYQKES